MRLEASAEPRAGQGWDGLRLGLEDEAWLTADARPGEMWRRSGLFRAPEKA
ncbi:hypothetical protein GCM10028799_23560 [Kribbella italica]